MIFNESWNLSIRCMSVVVWKLPPAIWNIVFRISPIGRIHWRLLMVNQSRGRRWRFGRACRTERSRRFCDCFRSFMVLVFWTFRIFWWSNHIMGWSGVEGGQASDASFGDSVFNLLDGQTFSRFVFLKKLYILHFKNLLVLTILLKTILLKTILLKTILLKTTTFKKIENFLVNVSHYWSMTLSNTKKYINRVSSIEIKQLCVTFKNI